MDSFSEDAGNIPVNFYGSALDLNEEDNEEEEIINVTTEVRYFKSPFAHGRGTDFIFRYST